MKLIKSVIYLESKSLLNKVKNWSEYKFQLLLLLLLLGLKIYSLAGGTGMVIGQSLAFLTAYAVDIGFLLVLTSLLTNIELGSKRLPFNLPKSAATLFYTVFQAEEVIFYSLVRELLLRLIISFFIAGCFLFTVTGSFFAPGWIFAWLGLVLLF